MEERKESKRGTVNLLDLPEGCISHILSLTSPVYLLRSALVCTLFRSISKSDLVWHNFLPSDYDRCVIGQRNGFASKKHLVLHLCRSFILLDGGTKSFALDKWTAKKCYMLGARELIIASGDNPLCWRWTNLPGSRFPEVAELLGVSELKITGRIHTQLLSPNTTYHAYFSFKIRPWSLGFDVYPVKVSVACLDHTGSYCSNSNCDVYKTFYLKAPDCNLNNIDDDVEDFFTRQKDGGDRWLKIDMGKYFNREKGDVAVLEMTLAGVETSSHKSDLVVHGIELLPLD